MHQIHEINEAAYDEWREYRQIEKKVKIGAMAEKKQRKLLSQYPPPVQQTMIDHSIQNSYQGLFPPRHTITAPKSTRCQSLAESLSDRSWAQ